MANKINNAQRLKRDMLIQTLEVLLQKQPFEKLEEIPYRMIPDGFQSYRCCIHKDRAILRRRIMSVLGVDVSKPENIPLFLSDAAKSAQSRKVADTSNFISVLPEACSSCEASGFFVVSCQGCLARPCLSACPVGAVHFLNGRSQIDHDKCLECGRCAAACPYHAIISRKAPCMQACPADAITRVGEETAKIDPNKCIECGACVVKCPFSATVERSHLADVVFALQSDKKVNILLAPSVRGQLPGSVPQLKEALLQIGFNQAIDIAESAEECANSEANELIERLATQTDISRTPGQNFMTTSCCPGWVNYAEKHLPNVVPHISSTPSPMAIAARKIRDDHSDEIIVFAGPCSAKKREAVKTGLVDYVISFEEMAMLLVASHVDVLSFYENVDQTASSFQNGVGFALSGGVLNAVEKVVEQLPGDSQGLPSDFTPIVINGLDKKNRGVLKLAGLGKMKNDFYEVMCCEGGCAAGPGTICSPDMCAKAIDKERTTLSNTDSSVI